MLNLVFSQQLNVLRALKYIHMQLNFTSLTPYVSQY